MGSELAIDVINDEPVVEASPAVDPVDFLVHTARTNYAAFVSAVHRPRFKHSTFSARVCRAIDQFVQDVLDGKRPILLIEAPPQHGKEFAHNTPMLTANRGWTTHGELRIGDYVYRPDGTTTAIIALSSECESDMRVTFTDGAVLATHANHEWKVHCANIKGRPLRLLETKKMLAAGVWKGAPGVRGSRANFQLPHVAALRGDCRELTLKPYTLGVWLGDGMRTGSRITVAHFDEAIVDGVKADGYVETKRWKCNQQDHHVEFKAIRKPLNELGLLNKALRTKGGWKEKFIPDEYFGASYAQRMDLLAGLIDSDGYVYPENGRVTIASAEPALVLSIERLIATFGWRVATSWYEPKISTSGFQGRERVAQICFQPDCVVPCRVERYRLAFRPEALKRKRAVAKIEMGSFGKGRCIQVAHPDGMYLVGDRLIPTHNSSLASKCLPPYLFGRLTAALPSVRIAAASYASQLARRNSRDAKSIMNEPIYREIFPLVSMIDFKGIDNADGFQVPQRGEFRGVGVGGSLTGFSVDVGIIDDPTKDAQEALSPIVQESRIAWYDSVLSTRLQALSGVVIIGTPWSAHDLLAHVKRTMGDAARFTLLSFPALNYPDEIGYRDDLPEGPLVPHLHSEEKLREMKAHMAEFWWSALMQQKPLAEFGAIFKAQYLQYYREAECPKQFKRVIMSVDATFKDKKSSDYVCVGVWGQTVDDRAYLLDWRREKLAFTATAQAIIDLRHKHPRATKIFIEDAANGPALIDMLSKQITGIEAVPPLGSKEARAHAVSWVWEGRQVYLPDPAEKPGIKPVANEITSFPDVQNDDAVDMMSIALHQLFLRSPIASLITKEILARARQ